MNVRKVLIPILLSYTMFISACVYIVLPKGLETPEALEQEKSGWSAFATNITENDSGNLHIDITIRNNTGDWSAMKVTEGKSVTLNADDKSITCETAFVTSGGHRLAPGFQMQGFTAGTKMEPVIQPIYVECAQATLSPGATLTIPYSYVTGQYNYYEQDKTRVNDKLSISLDEIITDLTYPIATPTENLIKGTDTEMIAINKVVLDLKDVQRTDQGFQFTWHTFNPSEYPSYVHIGIPPVIGEDGILYGFYESPDIAIVPITPAAGDAEWTTDIAVPSDVKNFYIMLSVETGKARLFQNYAIDISDK